MRGRIGVAVLLMATAAWLAAESQSYGGCHRRARRCGGGHGCYTTSGCHTGGYSGCGSNPCGTTYSGCGGCAAGVVTEGDGQLVPPAPPQGEAAPPAPPAPSPDAGTHVPAPSAPAVVEAAPQRTYYYNAGRRTRRWFRR